MTDKNYAKDQAAAQLSSIREMLNALNCDYDRMNELREQLTAHEEEHGVSDFKKAYPSDFEKLESLTDAAGECTSQDDAQQRIQEDPLSVQVRSDWINVGEDFAAEEFEILLCTGGPAVRILGELDEHNQPSRAFMQYQDWGTPWTDYYEEGVGSTCLEYAQQFYFGD